MLWPVGRTWGAAQAVPPSMCEMLCAHPQAHTCPQRTEIPSGPGEDSNTGHLPGAPSWEGQLPHHSHHSHLLWAFSLSSEVGGQDHR